MDRTKKPFFWTITIRTRRSTSSAMNAKFCCRPLGFIAKSIPSLAVGIHAAGAS